MDRMNRQVRKGERLTESQRQDSYEARRVQSGIPRAILRRSRGRLSKCRFRPGQMFMAFAVVASPAIFSALTHLISLCRFHWRRAGVSHGVEGRFPLARVARRLAGNPVGGGEYPGLVGRCQRLLGDRQRRDPAGRSVVVWTSDRGGSPEQRVHFLSIPVEDPHSSSEDTEGTARGRNRWVEGPPRYSQVIEEDMRREGTHPLAEGVEGISGIQDQLAGGPPSYRQVMEEERQRRETHLRTQDAENTGGAEDQLVGAPPSYFPVTQDDWSRRLIPVFARELLAGCGSPTGNPPPYSQVMEHEARALRGGHGSPAGNPPSYSQVVENEGVLWSGETLFPVYPGTIQNAANFLRSLNLGGRGNAESVSDAPLQTRRLCIGKNVASLSLVLGIFALFGTFLWSLTPSEKADFLEFLRNPGNSGNASRIDSP